MITRALSLFLALLGPLAVQDDPPPQDPKPQDPDPPRPVLQVPRGLERAFMSRDWVIGVAGNNAVLRSDVDLQILRNPTLRERMIRTRDERQRLRVQHDALEQRLQTLLEVQAGRDLGFDPQIVEEMTRQSFEARVEYHGGHKALSELLQKDGLTPEHMRRQLQDDLLARSWERSVVGEAPGATGRPAVDRYIRPGWQHSAYSTFASSKDSRDRALVGQLDQRYRLQHLHLVADTERSIEEAEHLASELRKQHLEEGTDFTFLVRTYGQGNSQEDDGFIKPRDEMGLLQMSQFLHGNDALLELVREGLGAVSRPIRHANEPKVFLYRLAEILPPTEVKPFADLELQQGLRRHLLDALDALRRRSAFKEVLDESYIWPKDFRTFLENRNRRR